MYYAPTSHPSTRAAAMTTGPVASAVYCQYLDDTGAWVKCDDAASDIITSAIRTGAMSARLARRRGDAWLFDIPTMVQTNKFGTIRALRVWTDANPTSCVEFEGDPSGTWVGADELSVVVEAMRIMGCTASPFGYNSEDHAYTVDLARGLQTNVATNRVRQLRFVMPDGTPLSSPKAEEGVEDCDDEMEEAAPDAVKCPIGCCIMRDPVLASDGFVYNRKAIETWFKSRSTSPMTGLSMPTAVIPCFATREKIRAFTASFAVKRAHGQISGAEEGSLEVPHGAKKPKA